MLLYKWIMGLAQKKPWWALVACLLVGIGVTWGTFVLSNRDRISELKQQLRNKEQLLEACQDQGRYNDSLHNARITEFMSGVIEAERKRSSRLERLEEQHMRLYQRNETLIRTNRSVLQNAKK